MINGIPHTLAIQNPTPLFIYNFSLLIHNLVIIQKILTNAKVITLYLLLRSLNSARQHLMFNLFSVFHSKCIKHIHQLL